MRVIYLMGVVWALRMAECGQSAWAENPRGWMPLVVKAGERLTNSIGMRLSYIPRGEFTMGSPDGEVGRDYGQTTERGHRVKLSRSFWMGVMEVTQAEWKAVMGTNPSAFKGDDHPVDNVSWDDAGEFCKRLSVKEGRRYRLPTEAEWEYGCRAGTKTAYARGDDVVALGASGWSKENSDGATHSVGRKRANGWGLFDMHGNVWEWCEDWHGGAFDEFAVDPRGPKQGDYRVIRGGSWNSPAAECRSACSLYNAPQGGGNIFGFRVVLETK